MLDVNESWGRHQAVRLLARIEDRVELAWIEEPVRRWDARGHRAVGRAGRTAVASGENLTGLEQFRPLLAADALQVVQAAGVWGITHFLRVATLAHGHDLPVSPVGYHANPLAHAAAAVPNHLVTEVQDIGTPAGLTVDQAIEDGGIVLGDAPGLGITVDESALAAPRQNAGWARPDGPHVRPRDAGLRLVPEPGPRVRPPASGRAPLPGRARPRPPSRAQRAHREGEHAVTRPRAVLAMNPRLVHAVFDEAALARLRRAADIDTGQVLAELDSARSATRWPVPRSSSRAGTRPSYGPSTCPAPSGCGPWSTRAGSPRPVWRTRPPSPPAAWSRPTPAPPIPGRWPSTPSP